MPRLNKAARKTLAKAEPAVVDVASVINIGTTIGVGTGSSSGQVNAGSSVFAHRYAVERGIDASSPDLRLLLCDAFVTVTPTQLLFHQFNVFAIRQLPKKLLATIDRAGVTLDWFDCPAAGMTARILHLRLPDGDQILGGAMYQAKLRRKTVSDELDLFVSAFGSDATQVELG